MSISISDVAKKAKVSISTVSRVVNGRNVVNDRTKKRVEKAIAELGYRPNMFARGLMLRKSNLLGLLLPDMHGEFYSEIIRGADQCARRAGRHLLVSSIEAENIGDAILSAAGTNGLLDGAVIMVSEMNSRICDAVSGVKVPIVFIDGEFSDEYDTVVCDQRGATTKLIHHVFSDGQVENLVFVGGPKSNIDSSLRLEACKSALSQLGKILNEDNIYHLDFDYSTAFDFGCDLVREWSDTSTCVFAANDETAAGIIHAAFSRRIAVPDQLRVVGFDDTRLAKMLRPQLTTVHVPMSELGWTAIEMMIDRVENPDRPARTVTLRSELVIRTSCGIKRQAGAS